MTKTKVLLSIDEDELKEIDAKADAAGMSRSAYLVAMGRQGPVRIFDAIQTLHDELGRYLERDETVHQKHFAEEVLGSTERLSDAGIDFVAEVKPHLTPDAVASLEKRLGIEPSAPLREYVLAVAVPTMRFAEFVLDETRRFAVEYRKVKGMPPRTKKHPSAR